MACLRSTVSRALVERPEGGGDEVARYPLEVSSHWCLLAIDQDRGCDCEADHL